MSRLASSLLDGQPAVLHHNPSTGAETKHFGYVLSLPLYPLLVLQRNDAAKRNLVHLRRLSRRDGKSKELRSVEVPVVPIHELPRRLILGNPDSYTRIPIRYRSVWERACSPSFLEEVFPETRGLSMCIRSAEWGNLSPCLPGGSVGVTPLFLGRATVLPK